MDFGSFQVRRFTKDELDQRFQQATCRAFYPLAVVDTELLAQYWFLTCSEEKPAANPGSSMIFLDERVKPMYFRFPEPIEKALKRLVLFPWGTWRQPLQRGTWSPLQPRADPQIPEFFDRPVTFGLPLVIPVSDSLTDYIMAAPSTAGLVTDPVKDPETGEYLGEQPSHGLSLDQGAIDAHRLTNQEFIVFLEWADTALERERAIYPFIDLAAGFAVKAFFSEGIEQLLWHITAIEAVLGENRDGGLTKLLKRRVGLILAETHGKRGDCAKLFGKLYDFRCDLVHGNEGLDKDKASQRHLGQARMIARAVVVWMLHYLDHVRSTLPTGATMPKRADLLAALDAAPASRLLARLPPGFPSMPEWRGL